MIADLAARLDDRSARIAVMGQGYVGLAVAMRANEAGFRVVGFEPSPTRCNALKAARSYVEDVPDTELSTALASGYLPSDDPKDLADFDVAVITVPTPLDAEGRPDLSAVETATATVGEALRPGCLVVLESTTYPGTTEELVAPLLTENSGGLAPGEDFFLGYSPERIDPGNGTHLLTNTPKVISGFDAESLAMVAAFYGSFVDKLVHVDHLAEAELTKLIENTFRHVNIALVNELAKFAHDLGVDIWSSLDAAATKPFGFMPFLPGPGVGGHCLPVDPSYLSWRVKSRLGETAKFVELANEVNNRMPDYVVARVQKLLNHRSIAVRDAHILVLGATYKPGSGDDREAPCARILQLLHKLGAETRVVEPYAKVDLAGLSATQVDFSQSEIEWADLVVVVTDHPDFDYELVAARAQAILDTRGRYRRSGLPNVELL